MTHEQDQKFQGATEARLDMLERNIESLWDKLNEIHAAVNKINVTLATQKGFSMAASAFVGAAASFLVSWLSKKI